VSSLDGDEKQELEKSTRRSRERVAFFLFLSNPNVKLFVVVLSFLVSIYK
jgi:hypothetical protein